MNPSLEQTNFRLALIFKKDITVDDISNYLKTTINRLTHPQSTMRILTTIYYIINKDADKTVYDSYETSFDYISDIVHKIMDAQNISVTDDECEIISVFVLLHIFQHRDKTCINAGVKIASMLKNYTVTEENEQIFYYIFSVAGLILDFYMSNFSEYKSEAIELANDMNKLYGTFNKVSDVMNELPTS